MVCSTYLRLRQWSQADKFLDNGFNEFIQKLNPRMHSSLIENWALHNSFKKMNFGESIGITWDIYTWMYSSGSLMYFSTSHYILMMNFMLLHGTLAQESWILLWGKRKITTCDERCYWLKCVACVNYIKAEKLKYHCSILQVISGWLRLDWGE